MAAKTWILPTVIGCALTTAGGVGAAATQLDVWLPDWGWAYPQQLNALVQQFEQAHPEIDVEVSTPVSGWEEYFDKFGAAVASGEVPDVAFYNRASVLENVQQLEPIDALLSPDRQRSLIPAFVKEESLAGHLYGLAFDADMRGIWWNVDQFDAAGLDSNRPPQFEELESYNQKLTRLDGDRLVRVGFVPWGNNWYPQGWYYAFGGDVFDWNTGRPDVENAVGKRVFAWFSEYAQRFPQAATGGLSGGPAFADGKVSMILNATSFGSTITPQQPDLNLAAGPAPFPKDGHSGTWSGGGAWVVPKGAQHVESAALFLNYLASDAVMLQYHEATNSIAPNIDAARQERFSDPNVAHIVADVANLNPRPPLWGIFNKTLGAARDDVISGKSAPEGALASAQTALAAAFDRAGLEQGWVHRG